MSATDDNDYSQLPLEDRLVHKVWKARLEAYQQIAKEFEKTADESDDIFKSYVSNPEIFKKIVVDSNVVAQEAGIAALESLLQYGGSQTIKLRSTVIPALCEKGLSSARAGTKQKTINCLMWFIELDTPDPVIELIVPSLSARLPKLVSGAVKALADIYVAFGAQTINPKLVLPYLPKLFSHADRTVRSETSQLTVELYKWMGTALEQILFPELKPVQQKDLSKAFESVKEQKPTQTRFLKSQREAMEQQNEEQGDVSNSDVEMTDSQTNKVDAFDLIDPINVLAKLPSDLSSKMSAPKWKDRVETLTEVSKQLDVLKMADEDYSELIRVLAKCLKDVNIQVVSLAANCIESLTKGLRALFAKYYHIVLGPLLERTKEKKQSVLDALNGALDSVFLCTSLSEVLGETLDALKHKTPQVRLAASRYLVRCLQHTTVAPTKSETESIMTTILKLVSESLPDIRTSASEVVGTLMKITGERELNQYLENLDDIKKKKITQFYEAAKVNAKPKKLASSSTTSQFPISSKLPATSTTKTNINSNSAKRSQILSKSTSLNSGPSTQLKKKLSSGSTIPSKRGPPISPLKSYNSVSRNGTLSSNRGGLTGRSLQSGSLNPSNHVPSSSVSSHSKNDSISEEEKQELEELRSQKQDWLKEKEKLNWKIQDCTTESSRLMKEIQSYSVKIDQLNEQRTNDIMTIKSKETQLQRANSDLEISNLRISQLENEVELLQKQRNTNLSSFINGSSTHGVEKFESSRDTFRHVAPLQDSNSTRGLQNEYPSQKSLDHIDEKVGNLTINGEQKENSFTSSNVLDTNDESWRRAAEVTSQLKARIEKMKAKSRYSTPGIRN